MKQIRLTALLLVFFVLLSACSRQQGNEDQMDPPVSNEQQTPDRNDSTAPNDTTDKTDPPIFPSDLTVELVVDSETANALLSRLDELTGHLRDALEEVGYLPDTVTLTFSTAGAYTADSLLEGGIAAAILPAVDIISLENRVSIIALSTEDVPETAIAVTSAGEAFSEEFCEAFFKALTETAAGQEFLSVCCADTAFSAPTAEGLQAVQDYLAELEKDGGELN